MANSKSLPPRPVLHYCPVCQQPQTKIQRRLGDDGHGSTNFICARVDCPVGINLAKVENWFAV
jgi:hypothetical protein